MAMKVFNVGDVLAAADLNEYGVNTRYAVKAADTSRTSTTTLTADPDLVVTADANKIYEMLLILVFTGPTAGGFKFDVTVPSGTVFTGTIYELSGSTGAFVSAGSGVISPSFGSLAGVGGLHLTTVTSSDMGAVVQGTLDTAGTGGSVTLRWAQDASTGTATILRQGSAFRLYRVS